MKKPVILITGGPAYDRQFLNESFMLNKTYTSAVVAAGGTPVMPLDYSAVDDYIEMADGFVFTGTHEFSPDPSLSLHPLQVERIEQEGKLMLKAVESKKPIFAICQGMQQLNNFLGGDISINFKLEDGIEHYSTYHSVNTVDGTLVNKIFGKDFVVNSFHNVKVNTLAPDLVASAYSPDGVIEAYEHKDLPVFGFQFHPERMRGDFPDPVHAPNTDKLFKDFINMCN